MASSDFEIQEINSMSSLNDFFSKFKDENINKCIDSITYDIKSQKVIIQMQNLIKNEAENVHQKLVKDSVKYTTDEIQRLSENYRQQYPELLKRYNEWKPVREDLIKILESSSDQLDRNSAIVSVIRIITSAADIFGTLGRQEGKSVTSWANFAMEHSSTMGLISLLTENIFATYTHRSVKKSLKSDQEKFKKLTAWFKQTEELDKAVKNIFPYGIDPDIVKRIDKSASDVSESHKIFMSIVASNVKENVDLFKDERFLDKADQFANSNAGKQWFHKILFLDDPHFNHSLNSEMNNDIQSLLKKPPAAGEVDSVLEGYKLLLSNKVRLKNTFNFITIVSACSNLLFGNKPEESEILRELASKTSVELAGIEKIVDCLRPEGNA